VAHHRTLNELERHSDLTNRLFTSRFAPHVREDLLRDAAAGSLPLGTRQSDITVLLSDIRGFTELTRQIGAQRTSDLLNEFFPALFEAIQAHHGTIERMMGDSILALFGSPEPDQQAEEHAVCAALAMQVAGSALTKSRLARNLPTCEIGIGIDCGEALHGFIGNAEWLQYAVVGNVPNYASRYCSAAGKGEILISAQVHGRIFNKINAERTEISTKDGKTLVAFRVNGLRTAGS
jgi:adenylate cyclase